jgi:hypothetical protein
MRAREPLAYARGLVSGVDSQRCVPNRDRQEAASGARRAFNLAVELHTPFQV